MGAHQCQETIACLLELLAIDLPRFVSELRYCEEEGEGICDLRAAVTFDFLLKEFLDLWNIQSIAELPTLLSKIHS